MKPYLIAPSLLSANFATLGQEAETVLAAGADMLHLDVMDNHYVPNLTVGPLVCAALRKYGIKAPIDVHLMTRPVDRLIVDFANAGASHIIFHPEASDHIDRSLALIHKHGCKAGLALNPATTLDCLEYVFDKLDIILVMSVNPGFGGQTFIPTTLEKIAQLKKRLDTSKRDIRLAVDGGVKVDNIGQIAQAGADMFIAGSAIFNQPDYAQVIRAMRQEFV
jgi:ribulose-phosphate 3-epimerase